MENVSSNLELQRKSCRVVIGIEGVKDGRVCRFLPKDFDFQSCLDSLSSDGFRYYAIIHDKDASEYRHIHLVLFSTKTIRLKQFLNSCVDAFQCDVTNVSVRETSNVVKNIQYLIHKNENDTKFKYSIDDIKTNGNIQDLNVMLKSDENQFDELISSENLVDMIKESKTFMDLYYKLGYKFVNNNLRTIKLLCSYIHPFWFRD